jgi:hypothetical protein
MQRPGVAPTSRGSDFGALCEHWETLRNWVASSREDIRFHRRLDEAARHWEEVGRPEGLLWRAPDLDLLRTFHSRAPHDFTPLQLAFFEIWQVPILGPREDDQ